MSKEQVLKHHGVLGMKWGVRRGRGGSSHSSHDGISSKELRKITKKTKKNYKKAKKDVKYLSDVELKRRLNRLDNEKKYVDHIKPKDGHLKSLLKGPVKKGLNKTIEKQFTSMSSKQLTKAIKKHNEKKNK